MDIPDTHTCSTTHDEQTDDGTTHNSHISTQKREDFDHYMIPIFSPALNISTEEMKLGVQRLKHALNRYLS